MSYMRGVERGGAARFYRWFRYTSVIQICLTVGAIVVALGIIAGVVIHFLPFEAKDEPQLIVTTSAIIIAGISVGLVAVPTLYASRRQRRLDTIEAYTVWSNRSASNLEILRSHNCIQQQPLEENLVHCLLRPTDFTYEQRRELLNCTDEIMILNIRLALSDKLNGLERIAVGVYDGAYDEMTLNRIAGSAIIKNATQYRRYILAARYGAYGTQESPLAFIYLDQLVLELKATFDKHGQEGYYSMPDTGRRH